MLAIVQFLCFTFYFYLFFNGQINSMNVANFTCCRESKRYAKMKWNNENSESYLPCIACPRGWINKLLCSFSNGTAICIATRTHARPASQTFFIAGGILVQTFLVKIFLEGRHWKCPSIVLVETLSKVKYDYWNFEKCNLRHVYYKLQSVLAKNIAEDFQVVNSKLWSWKFHLLCIYVHSSLNNSTYNIL